MPEVEHPRAKSSGKKGVDARARASTPFFEKNVHPVESPKTQWTLDIEHPVLFFQNVLF
jgi:hypothetical protein